MPAPEVGRWLMTEMDEFDGLSPADLIRRGETSRLWASLFHSSHRQARLMLACATKLKQGRQTRFDTSDLKGPLRHKQCAKPAPIE